ncbi:Protein kinase domain-containing protein, partial [Durusdinium trenchii]
PGSPEFLEELRTMELHVGLSDVKCLKEAESTTRHYVYVDNLGVLSPHKAVVATALQELDEHFGGRGLLLHPGEVHSSETRALGTILDGNNLCSKITPERFHRVRQSIRGLLNKKRVTGQMLEVVVGHATFCALNNRMLLSVFHSSYKFIKAHYFENSMIWDSVRAELTAFAGLMIFLRSDWKDRWQPKLWGRWRFNEGILTLEAARVEARLKPGKLTVNSCKDKKVPVLKPAETEEFLTTKGSLGAVPTLENPGDEPVAVRD